MNRPQIAGRLCSRKTEMIGAILRGERSDRMQKLPLAQSRCNATGCTWWTLAKRVSKALGCDGAYPIIVALCPLAYVKSLRIDVSLESSNAGSSPRLDPKIGPLIRSLHEHLVPFRGSQSFVTRHYVIGSSSVELLELPSTSTIPEDSSKSEKSPNHGTETGDIPRWRRGARGFLPQIHPGQGQGPRHHGLGAEHRDQRGPRRGAGRRRQRSPDGEGPLAGVPAGDGQETGGGGRTDEVGGEWVRAEGVGVRSSGGSRPGVGTESGAWLRRREAARDRGDDKGDKHWNKLRRSVNPLPIMMPVPCAGG